MSRKNSTANSLSWMSSNTVRNNPISVRLNVPEISASAPVPFHAGNPNTGIILVTFPPEVPVTIPPTSKRRSHVLRGNSVMHRMRLMS